MSVEVDGRPPSSGRRGPKRCGQLLIFSLSVLLLAVESKFHHLDLKADVRPNIMLSRFGFLENSTLSLRVSNFSVPEPVIKDKENNKAKPDKFGIIGFTLSRGRDLAESARVNPHLCLLGQTDQSLDALFFIFDFPTSSLTIKRSGKIQDIDICPSLEYCNEEPSKRKWETDDQQTGILARLWPGWTVKPEGKPWVDYVPLNTSADDGYSFEFIIRFNESQEGFYYTFYHNCFKYREAHYSEKVAVDFTFDIVEMNQNSHLSAGQIPLPQVYLYFSFLFGLASILWINVLCKSDSRHVYRVHHLMTFLVLVKLISLFCHGMNLYFLSITGHERQLWMTLFFIAHLLKGIMLFTTLILIGTGYSFFKNFLTTRDRNLFMIVLPLQVVDNVALFFLEESEIGSARYVFWFELFTMLDLLCCAAILFPIVSSIRHLQEGAKTDGKAMFNLEKLTLFRRFYCLVILYIYSTRMGSFFLDMTLPFSQKWIAIAVQESLNLFFYVLVARSFRPVRSNPYLKLAQEGDVEDGEALTRNGLYENVIKLNRVGIEDELAEIPGLIGGRTRSADESEGEEEDDSLLPKV
ncbi:hypothetical protein M3Y99_00063600 [Aphelenchoides fujianensis]|nr:hypothetical protein M3Y99_00063600 [Aphelenchoides fujianensis]